MINIPSRFTYILLLPGALLSKAWFSKVDTGHRWVLIERCLFDVDNGLPSVWNGDPPMHYLGSGIDNKTYCFKVDIWNRLYFQVTILSEERYGQKDGVWASPMECVPVSSEQNILEKPLPKAWSWRMMWKQKENKTRQKSNPLTFGIYIYIYMCVWVCVCMWVGMYKFIYVVIDLITHMKYQ